MVAFYSMSQKSDHMNDPEWWEFDKKIIFGKLLTFQKEGMC